MTLRAIAGGAGGVKLDNGYGAIGSFALLNDALNRTDAAGAVLSNGLYAVGFDLNLPGLIFGDAQPGSWRCMATPQFTGGGAEVYLFQRVA